MGMFRVKGGASPRCKWRAKKRVDGAVIQAEFQTERMCRVAAFVTFHDDFRQTW